MMKNLFTLLAVLCCSTLFAQNTYSIAPLFPQETYGPDADDLKAENTIVNLSPDVKSIRWERTVITLTPDCETQVCDLEYCYSPAVSTKTFELGPNEAGPLSVHLLLPDVISATAVVRLKFYDINNPADSIISVYTISTLVTGTEEEAAAARINLFPNPTVESFTLENAEMISAIRIFSLDGRQVSRMEAEPSQAYSLANQPAGTYVVVMENKQGNYVKAIEVRKQ
ncbi:MAG: T9SS type A sorting domain-containing protein [Saprospiraceae bacterium]|nr:T9SS type A sorting domain-containing protein [Saprospiraceae bacterium]